MKSSISSTLIRMKWHQTYFDTVLTHFSAIRRQFYKYLDNLRIGVCHCDQLGKICALIARANLEDGQ